MIKEFTYTKKEKLKSKKDIHLLFSKGRSINAFPIRVVHFQKQNQDGVLANMGVSVSKKQIKLAVNRNLIKRRIREAYRLNNKTFKNQLIEKGFETNLMFIYTSKQILTYKEIETKIKVLLTRLIELNEGVNK